MSDKKPWEQFSSTSTQDTEQKPWERFSGQTKPKEAERSVLSDIGNSIASGAAAAGRGILGLTDLATGSNSIQNLKNLGVDIKSSEQSWKDNLSEKAKQEEQAWNNTQGFIDTLKYGATHPFAVANKVAESLPAMAVSGGMGGAVTKGVLGGAIGEGMQQAGASYADAIEKNQGGTPSDKDALAAFGSGLTTGTISALSGGLAKKLGIGDVDTAIANRVAGEASASARPLGLGEYAKNIGKGFITEGALEELPQSATEQMWQNYADGKSIMEGVPEAAAQGLITGGLMGGAFNAANLPTFKKPQDNQDNQGQSSGPMPEVLPPDGSNGLPNNVQPNTIDGAYRDLTPTNAPQLTNEQQANTGKQTNGFGLNLAQLSNNQAADNTVPDTQAPLSLPQLPTPQTKTPSEQLGIDPNQGGLSSAAAIAVDTGASPITAQLQQANDQANWLNSIATPTAQGDVPQLGYDPQSNTTTQNTFASESPQVQTQVADLWNSQDPQQRMAVLGSIYGSEDMARQNALAAFDKLPKTAQQQITDMAVQNGAISESTNAQSSNGQTTQTAPQAPLTTLAQDIAPDSQANAAPTIEPILGKDGKNKWFATQNKADEFIQKKNLGDNYTIEQTGKMRYEIVPKAQPQAQAVQSNTTSSSKVDEQWLSDFTNQMLQDKQLSSQLSNPSNSDELTFSEFSRKFDENLAKNFTNNADNANEQSLLQNKNDNEIAKQQAYQLAKAQMGKNQQLDEQPTPQSNQATLEQNYETKISQSIDQLKQDKGIFGKEWYKYPQLNAKAKAAIEETLDKNLPSNIGKEEFQQRVESELNSIKINAMTQDIMPNIGSMPTNEILKTRNEVESQANKLQSDIDYAVQNHGSKNVGANWRADLAQNKRQLEVIDNELSKRGEQSNSLPQQTPENSIKPQVATSAQGYSLPSDINSDWQKAGNKKPIVTTRQKQVIEAVQEAQASGLSEDADIANHVAEKLGVTDTQRQEKGIGDISKFDLDVISAIDTIAQHDEKTLDKALAKAQSVEPQPQQANTTQPTANQNMLEAAKQSGRLEIVGLNDSTQAQNMSAYSPVEKRVPEGKRNAGALDIYGDWHGSLRDDYTLTPRQETLIKATQQAIDEGNFYNKDVSKRVAEILNVPKDILEQNTNNVEGGDFGQDVYYARQYIEKKQAIATNNQAKEKLGLKQGDKIGTVVTNTGKTLKNVVVQEVHDGGVTVHASSGNKRQQYTVGYNDIDTSIKRAIKEGKRQSFIKESKPTNVKEGIAEAQAKKQADKHALFDNVVNEDAIKNLDEKTLRDVAAMFDKKDAKPTNTKDAIEKIQAEKKVAKKDSESQVYRPSITTNKGEKLTYIGENKQGIAVYEDSRGVRVLNEMGVLNYEAVSIDDFNKNGRVDWSMSERQVRYFTKDELAERDADNAAAKNPIAEQPQTADNTLNTQQDAANVNTRRNNNDDQNISARQSATSMAGNDTRASDSVSTITNQSDSGRNAEQSKNGNDTGRGTEPSNAGANASLPSRELEPATPEQSIDNAIEQANTPQDNFKLSTSMGIGKGTLKDKLATNIQIIELLKELEATGRTPTTDEKTLLAKYTGFGGLVNAFPNSDGEYKKGWQELGEKLQSVLSDSEYKAARASSTSAFFTPPSVINAMWDIAQRLGYNGGMVLEPSIGVGSFIGFAPNKNQKFIGSEIDNTTFAIAKHLYPQANLFHQGYETLPISDNSVDLAIGNPPYGSVKLNFANKPHLSGKTIANQFMISTLEQVKPEGLSIMVVSSSFMDSQSPENRKAMAERGELVGAIRLPNSTFDDAGTAVVADILVFRKHSQATLDNIKENSLADYPSWVNSSKVKFDGENEVNYNPYFDSSRVAGEVQAASGEGGRVTYTVKETGKIDKTLKDFVNSFEKVKPVKSAKQITKELDTASQAMIESITLETSGRSAGHLARVNGNLVQVIERTDGTTDQLVQRTLTPNSVWSDTYTQDLDGRWYKIEDLKDKKGKPVKVLDKDGKPTNRNQKTKVYVDEANIAPQSKLGQEGFDILNAVIDLQGTLEGQLILEQSTSAVDSNIEANRKALAEQYSAFVKKYGYLNNAKNAKYIERLPKANLIFALEKSYTPEKSTGSKQKKNKVVFQQEKSTPSDILSRRMIVPRSRTTQADNAKDALTLSLAYRGKVDIELMSELTGKPESDIIAELNDIATPVIYQDPKDGAWVTADEYLSGNVREKFKLAQQNGMSKNADALAAVIPEDIPLENIAMRLGMNWITPEVYTAFAQHLLGTSAAKVTYEPTINAYNLTGTPSMARNNEFGAGGKGVDWILNRILNNREIKVTATTIDKKTIVLAEQTEDAIAMAQTIKNEFENWLFDNPDYANKLGELYNEIHNAIVQRKYDGSHIELAGKVPDSIIKLRKHQKNAVWRGVTTNAVLYDHAVGSGKTFTGIARAMERKHLGLSKKPVLVVPNHMINQFAQDIYRLYPAANILTATTADFAAIKRKKLFGKIATNDYDIIVLPHSSFEFIKLTPETQMRYLQRQIDDAIAALRESKRQNGDKAPSTKQLETLVKNLETKFDKLTKTQRKDTEVYFEQMGIDDITVDEAHEFKNLFYATNMSNIRGLNQPKGSNKAMDLWLKTQYIHETGGALAFMTGTPISNSAAEMHAMMRYLAPDILAKEHILNFDAWANTYADNQAKFEATESGQLKLATRFAREWQNMGSLMNLWQTVTDSVTNDDIKRTFREENDGREFPLPQVAGGSRQSITVAPTDAQDSILGMVLAGFAELESGSMDKDEAKKLRLRLMDLATKNSLDPRVIDPSLPAGGKLQAVADSLYENYVKWNDDKGTQIVFLDRSMPKGKSDDKVLAEYDAIIAKRDKAIEDGDDDALLAANEKLDKYDENEIAEMKAAQAGGFNAYDEIKRLLIMKGIPADEIRFIQEVEKPDDKQALFDKVNAGEVRIIFGSTPRMGAGTNIQKRLVALHHVDAPWKPSDIEQREGRIIRQGNELYEKYGHENFAVTINAYVTERTADAKRWDTMSAKLDTINAIRNYSGQATLDFQGDEDDTSFQEIAALATGNPLMRERVELSARKDQLTRASINHKKREVSLTNNLRKAQSLVRTLPNQLARIDTLVDNYNKESELAKKEHEKIGIKIDGTFYTERAAADAYLREKTAAAKDAGTKVSFNINGKKESYTNADALMRGALAAKGDLPIRITMPNGDVINTAAAAITDNVLTKINGHSKDPIFKLMGIDVFAEPYGGMTALVAMDENGIELGGVSIDANSTAIKAINGLSKLASAIDNTVPKRRRRLEQQLKENQDLVDSLSSKVGKPFPDAQELEDVTARLNEVEQALSDSGETESQFQDPQQFEALLQLLDDMAARRGKKPAKSVEATETPTDNTQYSQNGARSQTTKKQVIDTLSAKFGRDTINKLIKDGALEIISFAEAKRRNPKTPRQTDGYYIDGKAVLIADNLSPDMIIPTFLHELGGHGGLQTLMSDKVYQSLMREFDAMVKRGDKIAVDAKSLADAHSPNAKVAQDEYLPYLISLASRSQGNSKIKSLLNRIVMAVKSFIRDKFGVNLKVTPNDIVALAEKMVSDRANLATNQDILSAIPKFSQSALKSVSANIKRGKDAMNKALTEKTSVHRAMYRNDIGWVDFVWGDIGKLKANGKKTVGAKGISHIIEARIRKNNMTYDEIASLLTNDIVDTIAKGKTVDIQQTNDEIKLKVDLDGNRVVLLKEKGNNSWMVTAFELSKDETGKVHGKTSPTEHQSYSARTDAGALDNISINLSELNNKQDDIRYSQLGGYSPQISKLNQALQDFLKNPISFIKTTVNNKATDHLGKALALLGRRQLVDIYKKDLPPIKEYSDIVEQMDADSNEKAYEADKLVKEWGKLKDELPLAELMHDATLKGIDPAEAYQTGDDRAIYQQLRRRYDALSPDAKRIYKQARDDYKTQQRSVFEAIKGRIQRTTMSAPRQAELIKKMEQGFFFGQKVYFPLARFGNYVVAVKDAAGNIVSVSRAETQAQANQLRKELIAQYPNDKVGRVMLDKEFVSSRDGVTRGFMSDLFAAVDKLNISSQERAEFEDTLGQLYLNSLPDISFAKSGIHRKGTPGFSQNARRAYAQHMSRGSHYIAKMRHADVLQAKLDEMQEYVKAQGESDLNYDQPKMQRVVDEMEKRHESLMNNHTAGWSSLATSVGFMWYMGLSPASALVNLSQTALVAYPIMGAKWGFAKASKALTDASIEATKSLNDMQSVLSGDEKAAFDEAVKRGVIDLTQAHDLAGVARGEDDSVMWKIRKPMEWASFMFHHAEKFNRQVTFIASYRLAKQSGANHKQAIEQAIDATYEGHFSYAASNRPRMMQGDWARVFLLFKQYGQNMVYSLSRNAYLSAKGDKQAMKTLAGMLALHGTFAGVLGLPLATTLLAAASALGGDDDEPWDAEIALRNYLAELLGPGWSEVISKGLPRALGIDLSSRVGLDSLILPRMQEGLEGQRAGESFTAAMTGPVAGIGINAVSGFNDIQNGNTLVGTEKLLPKAIRDLVKTYRYATEGIVDKTGIEIMPQENVSLNDIGQQVLGFRSAKIAQAQEGKSAIYKMDREIGKTRQRLMDRYARAVMANDSEKADEIWQEIKQFNANIGKDYPKLKITKPKLMQSVRQRKRRINDAENGIYLPSSREASREYGAFANAE